MLHKSTYLYGTCLFIFGSLYCFLLTYPTKENLQQYRIDSISNENSIPYINKTTYTKTGVIKDVFAKSELYTRRYRISCAKSLISIDQKKNTLRVAEILEDAQILLQERKETKNTCRLFQGKRAFCNYHLNTLSSPELYFSLFDSFFPTLIETEWQGVAKGATLLTKKKSSPILQTDFITFFTPENI